ANVHNRIGRVAIWRREILVKHGRETIGTRSFHQTAKLRSLDRVDGSCAIFTPRAFVIEEEQCLVFNNRPAHGYSEEVLHNGSLCAWRIEKVAGVQGAVAQKLVYAAMKCVRTRLSDNVGNRPIVAPVFRRKI